jgi:ClpP class serine protease
MDNRQKGKTPLRKDDLHLFLRSDCDVRFGAKMAMLFRRVKNFLTISKDPVVHTLRLHGQIGDGSRGLSLRGVEKALENAFDEHKKNLVAVAISINSPGGSPVQSSLIYGRIRALSKETKIPVLCFAE